MAESLKFTPRTKRIAIKYHDFKRRVHTTNNPQGDIKLRYISTKKQIADIFTKPVDDATFFTLRKMLNDWCKFFNSCYFRLLPRECDKIGNFNIPHFSLRFCLG